MSGTASLNWHYFKLVFSKKKRHDTLQNNGNIAPHQEAETQLLQEMSGSLSRTAATDLLSKTNVYRAQMIRLKCFGLVLK